MKVLDELLEDHKRLHDLLILFERELLAYDDDKQADLQLMQDIARYYAEYFDRFHHPLEDCLFARMLSREQPEETGSRDAIGQHDRLRRTTDRILTALDRPLHDTIVTRAELVDAGRQFLRQNRDHIRYEELYPFEHARQYLTAGDWQAIDTAADSVRAEINLEQTRRQYDALLATLRRMPTGTDISRDAHHDDRALLMAYVAHGNGDAGPRIEDARTAGRSGEREGAAAQPPQPDPARSPRETSNRCRKPDRPDQHQFLRI